MDAPGLSLFQGSESIQLNATAQRAEEDEEQEDLKRRNEEIKDLLTNAFDDLEVDDDASSVDSSHYQDHTGDNERVSSIANSSSSKNRAVTRFQKEFGVYDYVPKSDFYEEASSDRRTAPIAQKDFNDVYDKSIGTENSEIANAETPYELPRPNSRFAPRGIRERNVNDNYTYNFETPSNHFDEQRTKHANNGYVDGHGNDVRLRTGADELGGGDNHSNYLYKPTPNGRSAMDDGTRFKTAEYESKEQLEVLYSIRMREINSLMQELQQLRLEREEEKNQLSRKLVLLRAEAERSELSRNQAQRALVDAKAEIVSLRAELTSSKEANEVMEKSNEKIAEELSIARGTINDLQGKIAVLERVQVLQASDKTQEKFLKQAQEKHAIEMRNMQTQIDVLTEKLNAKEVSHVALENKLVDARRAHETLMVEKADTMNRLAQALEESQAQCHNLMATQDAQRVVQLQAQIKLLSQEKEEAQKTIQELQRKLELAKADTVQYDSLLATTLEDESDSIRQMKLSELHRSKLKSNDDITNKLRGELQRCLTGQAVKRKEISRLENSLSQKEKEIQETIAVADTCREEAVRNAKRIKELEQELESLLTDQALKASAQIQKLSNHLTDVKKQCETLRQQKSSLEEKLEESVAVNREMVKSIQQENSTRENEREKEAVKEYNKEYLEIHAKAVERVRQEAQIEIVQMSVQLEQTQKELDHVKELYIDVCGTKEQLINDHKIEIETLMERYATSETSRKDMEKLEHDLQIQTKIMEKLTKSCDIYKDRIMELEKDLSYERKRKEDYTRRIHEEIEKAKDDALRELRNAHPDRQISVLLPDHCSEHLEKINKLEEDCKRLEEKLRIAVEEHKEMNAYRNSLDDSRLRIAQLEITQESWKKKCETLTNEKKELMLKLTKLNLDREVSVEGNSLKGLNQRDVEIKSVKDNATSTSEVGNFASKIPAATNTDEEMQTVSILEDKIKKLESDLKKKEETVEEKLKDLERMSEEKDHLVAMLKNQAMQLEQYAKNQKQVFTKLNLLCGSSNTSATGSDLQKTKETTVKELREEMEQRVVVELRGIEERHREKRKELEEKYKNIISELQAKCKEKTSEVETLKENMITERLKIHSSFKAKEQFVGQVIKTKLERYYRELLARDSEIGQLQEELKQKANDTEEERNLMAQLMTEWAAEIRDVKDKEREMQDAVKSLKESEEKLKAEIETLQEKGKEMKDNIDMLKQKYKSAKKVADNYKERGENKEKFLLSECKRLEEGYQKALSQVQRRLDEMVNTQEQRVAAKLKEVESHYAERMEQMRLTLKYKNKC